MPLVSIGDLFLLALLGTFGSGIAALLSRHAPSQNTISQCVLAISALIGLCASALFIYDSHAGLMTAAQLPWIGLGVTPLSAFFLLVLYTGVILTALYAIAYLPRYAHVYSLPWVNLVSALFIAGMQVTLFAPSVFWFLIGWEFMTASAYFLIIAGRGDESLHAGFLYIVMAQISFVCIMAGFLIMAHGNPFLDWPSLATGSLFLSPLARAIAFTLLFVGFGAKAGLVPLHAWLPYAHPEAPSHSSALLSGVMLKIALYGFVLALSILQGVPLWCAIVVIVVGLVSGIFGGLFAVVETDIKKMLAWSSIENMGLIFSAVGVYLALRALESSPLVIALSSATILFIALHVLNHFLFKAGLFMAVGAIVSETHTRDIDELGGLAQKWPLFSVVCMGLTLAASALPPLGTFFGEWVYVQALAGGVASLPFVWGVAAALVLSVIALIAGLAIFAFVKLFSVVFLGRARTAHAEKAGELPQLLVMPSLATVVLSLLVGLIAPSYLVNAFSGRNILSIASSIVVIPQAAISPSLVLFFTLTLALVAMIVQGFVARTGIRITETWDGGQPLTPRMQYTGTGFSSTLRFFFRTALMSRKELSIQPISPDNPWITKKRMEWGVASLWERALYQPLSKAVLVASLWVRKLQNGVIQLYILFVVVALIAALFFAL